MQAPQRIHSGWLGVLSTFTSILHAFVHCWQPIHLSFSILIPKNDILLNKEYIDPFAERSVKQNAIDHNRNKDDAFKSK